MWQNFSISILLMLFCTQTTHASKIPDSTAVNPLFVDSVLKNKIDSTHWIKIKQAANIYKTPQQIATIQAQKYPERTALFMYIAIVLFTLLAIVRVVFHDFFKAALEGLFSMKQFLIFYKTKKYDSLFAILSAYIFKLTLLSLVVYIGINYFKKDDFTNFHLKYFLDICLLLGVFFSVKNFIEYVFNLLIGVQETYVAFFLQNLFSEFILSIFLFIVFLIYIYNTHVSYNLMHTIIVFSLIAYIVFNTIRSYQLINSIRINYKLHFFMYICAFKVLPFLILVKFILNNIV